MFSLIRSTRLRDIIDTRQRLAADLLQLQSTILPRLQRVERELLSSKLERFFAELHIAIELTVRQGFEAAASIENGCRAMVAPLPRGKAGGLARANTAWRYLDGTFMPEWKKKRPISKSTSGMQKVGVVEPQPPYVTNSEDFLS